MATKLLLKTLLLCLLIPTSNVKRSILAHSFLIVARVLIRCVMTYRLTLIRNKLVKEIIFAFSSSYRIGGRFQIFLAWLSTIETISWQTQNFVSL